MAADAVIAAMTIYCEASSASQPEREAVAHVIRNRIAGGFEPTAAAVCTQYEQFSSWNGDRQSRNNLMRVMRVPDNDPVYRQCMDAWLAANASTDPTNGATNYIDNSIDPPGWAANMTMTLQTARFRFYRDGGVYG